MKKGYRNKFTDPDIINKIHNLENSKGMQETLKLVKTGMKEKIPKVSPLGCLGIGFGMMLAFMLTIVLAPISIPIVGLLLYVLITKLIENKKNITKSYVENFLEPVLDQILPDTKIEFYKTIDDIDYLAYLFSPADTYKSECNIVFGDDYNSEFSNITVQYNAAPEDQLPATIDSFVGQIIRVNIDTDIDGYLRIVPKFKKKTSKEKYPYRGLYGDEQEIYTESIKFNDNYHIYSTDNFYTRIVLDPNIIDIFNNWVEKMDMVLYVNNKTISILFKSDKYLFPAPMTEEEIDKLTLAGEYEKVIDQLADFYSMIDIILEKF